MYVTTSSNRQIAEVILSDIFNDVPVTSIFLKTKIYATQNKDDSLLEWVNNELGGYKDSLPNYRIIDSAVKVDVHRGFQQIIGYEYPIDLVKDDKVRDRLSHMPVHIPIAQIENLSSKEEGTIRLDIPVCIWTNYMGHCINGEIQRAYQYADVAAVKNIISLIKSLLIDFFSKIKENNNLDFATIIKSKENIVMNYNAAIINTGDGTVNASYFANVIGDNNTVVASAVAELMPILDKLNELIGSDNKEYNEISEELKTELSKAAPNKSILKRGFQAIKGIVLSVSTEVLAGQITPLLEKAIAILQI